MMRVGKRGLNLAANAAVTAAAKVRLGQTPTPGTPPCSSHLPGWALFHLLILMAVKVWGLCSSGFQFWLYHTPASDFHSASHSFLIWPKGKCGPSLSVVP